MSAVVLHRTMTENKSAAYKHTCPHPRCTRAHTRRNIVVHLQENHQTQADAEFFVQEQEFVWTGMAEWREDGWQSRRMVLSSPEVSSRGGGSPEVSSGRSMEDDLTEPGSPDLEQKGMRDVLSDDDGCRPTEVHPGHVMIEENLADEDYVRDAYPEEETSNGEPRPLDLNSDATPFNSYRDAVESLPQSCHISNHAALYDYVPRCIRQEFVGLAGTVFSDYYKASRNRDLLGMYVALNTLMRLPSHTLQKARGRNFTPHMQARMSRVGEALQTGIFQRGTLELPPRRQHARRDDPVPKSEMDKRVKNACDLVRQGYVSRAARSLLSQGVMDAESKQGGTEIQRIFGEDRHDQTETPYGNDGSIISYRVGRPSPEMPAPHPNATPQPVDDDEGEFHMRVLKLLRRGKGQDYAGWAPRVLLACMDDDEVYKGIVSLCKDIRRGDLPPEMRALLVPTKGILAHKDPVWARRNPARARPIEVDGLFLRLAMNTHELAPGALSFLAPTSVAVKGQYGGSQLISVAANLRLNMDSPQFCATTDVENAYPNVPKDRAVRVLQKHPKLACLQNILIWMLDGERCIYFRSSKHSTQVLVGDGVGQGGWASALLCELDLDVVVKPVMQQSRWSPYTDLRMCIDDLTLFADDPVEAIECMDQLKTALGAAGYGTHKDAAIYLGDRDLPAEVENYYLVEEEDDMGELVERSLIQRDAAVLLGGIIGNNRYDVSDLLRDRWRVHEQVFQALRHSGMPRQTALLLMRLSTQQFATHVCRTTDPWSIQDPLRDFDRSMVDAFVTALDIPDALMTQQALAQLHMPLRLGGAGIRSAEAVSPIAFLSCFGSAICSGGVEFSFLRDRGSTHMDTVLARCIRELERRVPLDKRPEAWTVLIPPYHDDADVDEDQPSMTHRVASFYKRMNKGTAKKLQHRITDMIEKAEAAAMLEPGDAKQHERARYRCLTAKNASSICTAYPVSRHTRVSDEAVRAHMFLRLGLPLTQVEVDEECICKPINGVRHRIDEDGPNVHQLCCRKFGGAPLIARHNAGVDVLADVLRAHGAIVQKEPRCLSNVNDNRVDLLAYWRDKAWLFDFTVIQPAAPSFRDRAARSKDQPIHVQKERQKTVHHKAATEAAGRHAVFWPFVVDVYGGFGPKALELVSLVQEMAAPGGGCADGIAREVAHDIITGVTAAVAEGTNNVALIAAQRVREARMPEAVRALRAIQDDHMDEEVVPWDEHGMG